MGKVAHTIILATQEVAIRKIAVGGQLRQKISEASSQQTSLVLWFMPVIPAT
jgi:hypothetical protein